MDIMVGKPSAREKADSHCWCGNWREPSRTPDKMSSNIQTCQSQSNQSTRSIGPSNWEAKSVSQKRSIFCASYHQQGLFCRCMCWLGCTFQGLRTRKICAFASADSWEKLCLTSSWTKSFKFWQIPDHNLDDCKSPALPAVAQQNDFCLPLHVCSQPSVSSQVWRWLLAGKRYFRGTANSSRICAIKDRNWHKHCCKVASTVAQLPGLSLSTDSKTNSLVGSSASPSGLAFKLHGRTAHLLCCTAVSFHRWGPIFVVL